MTWRRIWFDNSGRLRSGWRALIFLLLAGTLAIIFTLTLAFVPLGLGLLRDPQNLIASAVVAIATLLGALLAGVWLLQALEHLPASTLGLNLRGPWLQAVGVGLVIGVGLICFQVFLLWVFGVAEPEWRGVPSQVLPVLLLAVGGALLFAASEEVIFRGYLFQTLLRGIGPLGTLLLLSAVFATVHLMNPAPPSLLGFTNLFLAGIMFGLLYLRTGSLWLPISMHAGWNFGQLLFHLPISGYDFPVKVPLAVTLSGPAWLHGGAFGLEGGVAASALLLGVIALLTYTRRGLPLNSYWWEWRDYVTLPTVPPNWDFSIGDRHYQWKLFVQDNPE
ncbi:MAG: CPBP family intramembrane glutamic endopeptidase [Armatimonadota bacterium]